MSAILPISSLTTACAALDREVALPAVCWCDSTCAVFCRLPIPVFSRQLSFPTTVTVALGASLFETRPWLKSLKPRHLQRMSQFTNDALVGELCHGDLSLQFCANTADTNIHALRDVLKNLPEYLVPRWKQEGNVPTILPNADGKVESARNFLGFRDGSANPHSGDESLMDRIVWVGPNDGEPEWTVGGTYQAVRIVRSFVERWDRTPLGEQERIIGRKKMSGAPFDGSTESDVPNYAKDPDGKITRLDAHIRLANPRTAETNKNLLLRRPFNYSNGFTKNGQLDQGLLFIAYQSNLERGFITVQSRLKGEPLEEYIKPIGGGYFFVLPGAQDAGDYLGRKLAEAAAAGPEEVAATKISGEEDRYSHTDLWDFKANFDGSKKIYDLVKPLIEKDNADFAKRRRHTREVQVRRRLRALRQAFGSRPQSPRCKGQRAGNGSFDAAR